MRPSYVPDAIADISNARNSTRWTADADGVSASRTPPCTYNTSRRVSRKNAPKQPHDSGVLFSTQKVIEKKGNA